MHGVRVAEEVVHIAEDFLVSTHEEHADVIMLALAYGVQREVRRLLVVIDVRADFAVRVAGDVLQGCRARGLFVEPRDGHDGEELVDAPGVGHGLEEREVAEIFIRHRLVEVAQFVGHVLLVVHEVGDFVRDAPIEAFDVRAGFKVDDAVAEEIKRFVADILRIVPVFEHGA